MAHTTNLNIFIETNNVYIIYVFLDLKNIYFDTNCMKIA